eukprot:scaffold28233_cov112-Isochrysis_galbana.AAC.3
MAAPDAPGDSLVTLPLSGCFARLQAAYKEIDDSHLPGGDPKLQRRIAEGLVLAERCSELISHLSVFSSNEELEDINTGDLKYLLVPFFRGELLLRVQEAEEQGSHEDRLDQLKRGSRALTLFLEDIQARKALRGEAKAGWEEQCSDRLADPGAARTLKIARLKAAKRAKDSLAAMLARAAAAGDDGDGDDETDRSVGLLSLELCAHTALDSLRSTAQEVEMLEMVAKMKQQNGGRMPPPPPPPPPAPNEVRGSGLQTLDLPAGSVIEMRAGVTGRLSYGAVMDQLHTGIVPGLHSLSVEEGMRREEAERALAEAEKLRQMGTRDEERRRREEKGYDSEEEAEELRKARAKDEYRDNHTRGAGNRKNRS